MIKNKLITILISLLVISMITSSYFFKRFKKERDLKEVAELNLIAKSEDISRYISKLGDSVSVIQGLRLNIHDLKKVESSLYKEISALKIKLKNVSSVVKIEQVVKYVNKDSIIYVPQIDSSRKFTIDDPWIKASVIITDCSIIKPGDFRVDSIPNPTIIATETKYKRRWIFWRKPTGVQVQVVSKNPYIKTESGTYIEL